MDHVAALSVHPVSSHATGEVVGRILETLGSGPDTVLLAVTPGHGGALEDIAGAVRTLLRPRVLLAMVATGVGADGTYVDRGAGMALWAAGGADVRALGGPDGAQEGPDFERRGAIVVTCGGRSPAAPQPTGPAAIEPFEVTGAPLVAGWVTGPVLLDGHRPGPGPVGVAFGPGATVGTALVAGLRPVGPQLTVTRAERTMIHELDGIAALVRLHQVATDAMAAADRSRLADGLHLEIAARPGTAPAPPVAVLGADRDNGAVAVAVAVAAGTTVQFAVRDPASVAADLLPSIEGSDAAVLLAAPGHGRALDDLGRVADDLWGLPDDEGEPVLPGATLTAATTRQHRATVPRSEPRSETTVAAYFT